MSSEEAVKKRVPEETPSKSVTLTKRRRLRRPQTVRFGLNELDGMLQEEGINDRKNFLYDGCPNNILVGWVLIESR